MTPADISVGKDEEKKEKVHKDGLVLHITEAGHLAAFHQNLSGGKAFPLRPM